MSEDLTETVRRLWRAFTEGGLEQVVELVDDDVEWLPSTAGGRVLHGREELLAWDEEMRRRGVRLDAHVYALEQRGDAVLVAAHVRVSEDGVDRTSNAHWVYRFASGRLRRAESYPSRDEALAALGPPPPAPG